MHDFQKNELKPDESIKIGKLIVEGNTSGRLDTKNEDEQGNTIFISWDLKFEKWSD